MHSFLDQLQRSRLTPQAVENNNTPLVFLAPLAGVSDHPFRRLCARQGAHLTYVEMLSAAALNHRNQRTLEMAARHPDEQFLGVQLTGSHAGEIAEAICFLDSMDFDTIDINMGCPVKKVVKTGCGSALIRDPKTVYQVVAAARQATAKPLSVKIRIGWDRQSINALAVVKAAEEGGADWITVHGRTRSDDYAAAVALDVIREVCQQSSIPVLGNGNIFSSEDAAAMLAATGCRGVMVSRGALGDPWVFGRITGLRRINPCVEDWLATVLQHLQWQEEVYGTSVKASVCMRKHMLWYLKGWPDAAPVKAAIGQAESLSAMAELMTDFAEHLKRGGVERRFSLHEAEMTRKFTWDPKFDMDRILDRAAAEEGYPTASF